MAGTSEDLDMESDCERPEVSTKVTLSLEDQVTAWQKKPKGARNILVGFLQLRDVFFFWLGGELELETTWHSVV